MKEKFKAVPKPRKSRSTVSRPDHAEVGPRYVLVRSGKVHKSKWLIDGMVSADFDKAGNLLGVEVIR